MINYKIQPKNWPEVVEINGITADIAELTLKLQLCALIESLTKGESLVLIQRSNTIKRDELAVPRAKRKQVTNTA